MQIFANFVGFIRRQPRWRLLFALALLAAGAWLVFKGGAAGGGRAPTFAARRGPLDITVLEGGSLQALESQEVNILRGMLTAWDEGPQKPAGQIVDRKSRA